MRSRRRTDARRHGRNDGSFWLSFSDLMSSLVLIVILVMFYIIYQYFNLAEINQAEISRRQTQLDAAQAELEAQQGKLAEAEQQMIAQQTELDSAQAVLESQRIELADTQTKLSEKEAEIATQQAQLAAQQTQLEEQQAQLVTQKTQLDTQQAQLAAQQTQLDTQQAQLSTQKTQLEEQQAQLATQKTQLDEQQAQLSTQKTQLDEQQAQLSTQQTQLATQKTQLDEQQAQLSTQQTQLDTQQAQLEQLVGLKTRIITSLSSALRSSNISASVDPATGSIALESDVLFESGEHKLTDAGKRFVDKLLPVYLDVLFSEEYRTYVSEIIIEGHTDSVGGYLSNLELSQQRALAVASYVLGDSCRAVSADVKNELRKVVTVNGRSYSDRIFNENGTENMAASRRVVFKFRLTDEQMIQQLREILESE